MKEMITKYPNVAKEILDKCHRVTSEGEEYLFSMLEVSIPDPDNKLANRLWDLNFKKGNEKARDTGLELNWMKAIGNTNGKSNDVLHPGNPFLPTYIESNENSLEEETDTLISHKVTKRLIYHKWNKFGLWYHFLWFMFQAIYTSFITVVVVDAKVTQVVTYNWTTDSCGNHHRVPPSNGENIGTK